MKRTLMISVAAIALAAGSTVALSQGSGSAGSASGGAGGNTPMATPSAPSGGQDAVPSTKGTPGAKGAQERVIPDKQKSTQQAPATGEKQQKSTEQAPATGEKKKSTEQAPATGEKQKSTQQAPTTTQAPQQQQQQGQAAPSQQRGQAAPSQSGQAPSAQSPSTGGAKQGAAERPMTSSNVSLTVEQKTTIRRTVLTGSAPRVTNINFELRVGTVVPRTVRVAPLPVTIIEIQPAWRGYMYFVYNDEIIVVEPGTLRIVAVLEV